MLLSQSLVSLAIGVEAVRPPEREPRQSHYGGALASVKREVVSPYGDRQGNPPPSKRQGARDAFEGDPEAVDEVGMAPRDLRPEARGFGRKSGEADGGQSAAAPRRRRFFESSVGALSRRRE